MKIENETAQDNSAGQAVEQDFAGSPNEVILRATEGRVILPQGASLDDLTSEGRDLVIELADGTRIVIPDGAIDIPEIVIEGVVVPAFTVSQLLNGNEPEPEAGATQSSGGNFADAEGEIQAAFDIGDLLPFTSLSFPEDTEEEIIPAANEEPEVLIETEDNPAGAQDATASVDEDGLPEREDEPEGTREETDSETTSGTIVFEAPDGLRSIIINDVEITAAGQTVTTPFGVLTITSIDLASGEVDFSYSLADNVEGVGSDTFAVQIVDTDGDVATATLNIVIEDDAPIAQDDTAQIAGGTFGPIDGNVLPNDEPGADGYDPDGAVLEFGNGEQTVSAGETIQGQYGSLTLNADGSYTYTRDHDTPGGVSDTFEYTIVDSDGSTSSASLIIQIGNAPPAITEVPRVGDGTEVEEGALAPRGDSPAGSGEIADGNPDNNSDTGETTQGTITFNSPDGVKSVTLNGVEIDPGSLPQTIIDDDQGTLVVIDFSFDPVTGDGTIVYDYTLKDNAVGDDVTLEVDIVITDLDDDAATDSLVISIVDDAPEARDDLERQAEENADVTVDVLDNDIPGADGVSFDAVELIEGSLTGLGTVTYNNDGTFTYSPAPGEEGVVTFEYSITDADGDTSKAVVTIELLEDSEPRIATEGENVVDEAGLGERPGEPAGSDQDSDSEFTSGAILIETGNDTVKSLVINGVDVTAGGEVTTAKGVLTISLSDGAYSYTYELTDNTLADTDSDTFTLVVTDSDDSSASTSLVLAIVDDAPGAEDDAGSVPAGTYGPIQGNVLSNDTQGADGASVTIYIGAGDPGAAGETIDGVYGTLSIAADGTYTYTRNEGTPGGVIDTFGYQITDGDLDTASALLVISIANSGTELDLPISGQDGTLVFEAGLDGPPAGSDAASNSEVTEGSFEFSAPDGPATVTIGGVAVTAVGQTFAGAFGTIEITAITDGSIGYRYTLDNRTDGDTVSDTFDVKVTDVDGDFTDGVLEIDIVDDVPEARDDGVEQSSENAAIEIDALANDVFGADDVDTSDPAKVFVSTDAAQGAVVYDPVTGKFTYTPDAGAGSDGNLTDFFEYTIIDADGDISTARVDITLQPDSEPQASASTALVDDDGLAGGNPSSSLGDLDANNGDDPADTSEATFTGQIGVFVGNDGPATVSFEATLAGSTAAIGQETVTYSISGAILTATITGGDRDGTALFTVEITDDATGEYVVTLLDNVIHAAGDNENNATLDIGLIVSDIDADTSATTLTIVFDDDAPTAADNSNTVNEGASVSGNVLTDDDGSGIDLSGADGLDAEGGIIALASVTSGGSTTSLDINGNLVITTTLGQLTVDPTTGDYSYVSAPNATNVDAVDVFTYTIVDADGDTSEATLTINIANAPGEVSDNDVIVDEAGLADGSDPTSDREIDSDGQITVAGATGALTFSLAGGVAGPGANEVQIDGVYGTIVLDTVTGEYTYSLDTAFTDSIDENGPNTVETAESFTYEVHDASGNLIGSGIIDVDIVDDVPTATDQASVSVAEDAASAISGNVLTDGTPDTAGADGAAVTSIMIGTDTYDVPQDGSSASIILAIGTYTIDSDGNWTFDPAADLDHSSGDIDASFTYTLTDGDGDFDTATQPILITDGEGPIAGDDIALELDDETLPDGSAPGDTFDSDTIAFTEGSDTIQSIVFGDTASLGGGLTWVRVSDTQITGSDAGRLVVTLDLAISGTTATVTATLEDNYDDHPDVFSDDTAALGNVDVVATDRDGDMASATVEISVSDDLPSVTASDPSAGSLTVDETDLAIDAKADFSALFTSEVNADGPGTPISYALDINAGATGLVDTATNEAIVLSMNGSVVEGKTANSGLVVFTVSVDSASGEVTLDQQRAIKHSNPANDNEPASLASAGLITLTATLVDSDNDEASATADIAGAITFLDDGPQLSNTNVANGVSVDETDGLPASASGTGPIITATRIFGADGAKTGNDDTSTSYVISVTDTASGLATADGDYPITLVQVDAATIEGRFNDGTGDLVAFKVVIKADGSIELTQNVALEHEVDGDNTAGEHNDVLDLAGKISATVTITDGDDDTASATADIGGAISFFDDGPEVRLSGAETSLQVSDVDLGSDSESLADNFTFIGGEDGTASTSFALSAVDGSVSGLVDSDTGEGIFLFLESGTVVGRVGSDAVDAQAGDIAFTVSVDGLGNVTLDQQRAIDHALSTNSDGNVASLASDDLVSLTASIIDLDGDTASKALDIGSNLLFSDDAPAAGDNEIVKLDDDALGGNPGGTGDDVDGENTTGILDHDFGNDGGSIAFATTGAPSGFQYVASGTNILIQQEQGTGNFVTVVTVTLNSATGEYAVTQNANILHPDGDAENNTVFTLGYTVSDKDGDSDTSTLVINVDDDTPTGAVVDGAPVLDDDAQAGGNAGGTGDVADNNTLSGAAGTLFSAGADGALSIAVTAPSMTAIFVDTSGVAVKEAVTWTSVTNSDGSVTVTGSSTSIASVAVLTVNTDGSYSYAQNAPVVSSLSGTPGSEETDTFDFALSITDGDVDVAAASLSIFINDDTPTAAGDGEIASVDDNASAVVVGTVSGLIGNDDFGADGQDASGVTIATGSLGGTITIDTNGNLLYTSATNITAPFVDQLETFTYTITDGDGDTTTATFTVRLTDEGPAIDADAATFTVDEEGLGGIAGNGDSSGDTPGELIFQSGNLAGIDFGADGAGSITLTAVANTGLTTLAGNAVKTVWDAISNTLTGQDAVTGADVFTLEITDVATGAYEFTLLAPVKHPDGTTEDDQTFTVGVVVSDAEGETANGTITITIDDDSPVATDDTNTLNEDTASVSGDVINDPAADNFGADGAGDPQIVAVTGFIGAGTLGAATQGEFGSLILNADGSYTYNLTQSLVQGLDDGEFETDTFTYTIIDADGDKSQATLTITIDGANDAPVAVADTNWTIEDAAAGISGNVLLNVDHSGAPDAAARADVADADVDGDTLTVITTGTLAGTYGVLTLNSDGSYDYRLFTEVENPAAFAAVQALSDGDAPLQDVFNYTASDGDASSDSTLTIDIFGKNDAPVVGTDSVATSDEGLAGGLGDTAGTSDTTNSNTATGTISITDPDDSSFIVTLGIPTQSIAVSDGTASGAAIAWSLSTDGKTLTGTINGGTQTAITVTIDNDGDFTVTQSLPIFHSDDTQEDDTSFSVDVKVNDGTTLVTKVDAITVSLEDDSPVAVAPDAITVTNGAGPVSPDTDLDSDGTIANNVGGDGGTVRFLESLDGAPSGLTSSFTPIIYVLDDPQTLRGVADGVTIFTIQLDPANGTYTVDLDGTIDSTSTVSFDPLTNNFVGGNNSWAGFLPLNEDENTAIDNDSQDLLLTPAIGGADDGTVNSTANIGGIAGGASVGNGETFRVDFVTDLRGDPADGKGDYDTAGNRDHVFDGHYTVNGASALFKSTSGSTVKVQAFDDPDGDNVVGDGAPDIINGVAITWRGIPYDNGTGQNLVTLQDANNDGSADNSFTLSITHPSAGTQSFTIIFNVDGTVSVSGVEGDSGSSQVGTEIAVFTADGYNSVEYSFESGNTFQIGGFGATTISTDPVTFNVPVEVVDNDGDVSAQSTIEITAVTPSSTSAGASSSFASKSSELYLDDPLMSSNDNKAGETFAGRQKITSEQQSHRGDLRTAEIGLVAAISGAVMVDDNIAADSFDASVQPAFDVEATMVLASDNGANAPVTDAFDAASAGDLLGGDAAALAADMEPAETFGKSADESAVEALATHEEPAQTEVYHHDDAADDVAVSAPAIAGGDVDLAMVALLDIAPANAASDAPVDTVSAEAGEVIADIASETAIDTLIEDLAGEDDPSEYLAASPTELGASILDLVPVDPIAFAKSMAVSDNSADEAAASAISA